jgi:tetratricopeptide (TPR) repeat protein
MMRRLPLTFPLRGPLPFPANAGRREQPPAPSPRGRGEGWGEGQSSRRPLRALGLCGFLALAGAPITAAAAAELLQPAAPIVPRNAEAEAATYQQCMNLARRDPAAAEKLALSWHERGGAHPADHCAAVALIGLKQYKEAATRLEALAHEMTTAPIALRAEVLDQAGQAWGLAGDPVRAYAAAGEAVALQPKDLDLLIDRAEAAAAAGYFDKAVDDLDHVLKADPGRVEALIYRASANRALDHLDPALADIERALARVPNSATALLERGNIRRLQGDNDGARQDWQRVGQLAPGSQADMAARANIEHLDSNKKAAPVKPDADH